MKRLLVDLVVLAVLATAAFGLALALHWTSRERTLDLYLLALGALAMLALVTATREGAPRDPVSRLDAALRTRRAAQPLLPELERRRRETALGVARAFDFHVRLRPLLHEIAAQRVASRHGIDFDAQPDAARAVIGDEAYELLRSGKRPPDDRFAPGVDAATLGRLLDALETM